MTALGCSFMRLTTSLLTFAHLSYTVKSFRVYWVIIFTVAFVGNSDIHSARNTTYAEIGKNIKGSQYTFE